MREGILISVFGTAEKEARQKCIYPIENHIKSVYADKKVYLAFTSGFIANKLKKLGEDICTAEEIFEKIHRDNIRKLTVMPVLMTKGEEYEKLRKTIDSAKGDIITDIKYPVLNDESDFLKIADILAEEYQGISDSIIFMGHGNKNFSGTEYIRLNEKLREKGNKNMHIACVEGEPSLEKAVESINGKKVLLAPLMICAGEHIKNDMAGDSDKSWKNILVKKGFDVKCVIRGFGEMNAFREFIAERISRG